MRRRHPAPTVITLLLALMIAFGGFVSVVSAQGGTPVASPMAGASPEASPIAQEPLVTGEGEVDLDVLYIGAHPDDEAGRLSTFGQWNELNGAQVGVITITRGEGGGNAVGTEEGPALGLVREAEERNAVGMANIDHVYNLDKVDFYYSVSAELTEEAWGYEDTLDQVVRVVRETKPEIIVTMNPAPTPGNHGHHQMAARLAVDAYYAAADPEAFPEQLSDEGLSTWSASRILRNGATGEGTPGPECATSYQAAEPTDYVFGVWAGTQSAANGGETWATIERRAQQSYATQGWAVFPDAPTDPNEIECDWFTLIDSRAPFDPSNTEPTAILEGAVLPVDGGLPLGAEFYLTTDAFDVSAGQPFEVTATLLANSMEMPAAPANVELTVPDGWEVSGPGETTSDADGAHWTFTVTPAADAATNTRFRIDGTVTIGDIAGMTSEVVRVASGVTGVLEPLPEVAAFREWVAQVNAPQLDSLIFPVFSMGVGESREVTVDLISTGDAVASGSVSLELPAGFEADAATQEFSDLAAGATGSVTFTVTNTDDTLPTANQGGEDGNYPFTITTTTDAGSSTQDAGINLVPVTTVPAAATAPTVDGVVEDGEYAGEALDLSRVWEGADPDSPQDASGSAYVTWTDEGIYVAVEVTDDTLGTVLPQADAKRHWRTDSVEIAIDPLGTASNTSSTFKVGIFPETQEGGAAAYRDADAYQGPIATTAPGMEVASTVSDPYSGYVIETLIPFDALPADLDPQNAAMNIFIYDSDTQDLTGQTRLGWSTWGGVQGDPYRWGKTIFEGFEGGATPEVSPVASPVAGGEPQVDEPILPLDVALSVDSPLSILQSANDGVGLGGHAKVPEGEGLSVDEGAIVEDGEVSLTFTANSDGAIHLFVWSDGAVVGEYQDNVSAGAARSYGVPLPEGVTEGVVLVSFVDSDGRVQAIAEPFGG